MGKKEKDKHSEELRALLIKSFVNKYEIELDSFTTSIEPYYFWLVDFLKNALKYNVEKHKEELAASVVSQFFGEMSARKQHLERSGMEIVGTINTVIKSIINLLYDLREFDRRLDVYKDLHSSNSKDKEGARFALKRIWMDEVDVRKGGASILGMSQAAQGPGFATLRDGFMMANNQEDLAKIDLNERVKNVLKGRITEYNKWEKESEKELTQRRKIELTYLKSQVEGLRLYTLWAKPYLKAAQMLSFKDPTVTDAELIQAFDQNLIEIVVRGNKKTYLKDIVAPGSFPKKFNEPLMKESPFPSLIEPRVYTKKEMEAMKSAKSGPFAYSIIELRFVWRTKPAMVSQAQTGGAFRQIGNLKIQFIGYVMTPKEYESLKRQEEYEAMKFIEGMTTESLVSMREELEKYLGEIDIEQEKKEKKKAPLLDRLFPSFSSSKSGTNLLGALKFGSTSILEKRVKQFVVKETCDRLFGLYDRFKKAHQLKAFPDPPEFKPVPKTITKPPDPVKF